MKRFDRVWETTTTTGTNSYVLAGAKSEKYRAFGDVLEDGDYTEYFATDGTDWERGWGKYTTATTTLTRNLIESSTESLIDWGSGTKDVFIAPPAASLNDISGIYVGTSRPAWLPANSLWIKSDASPVTLYVYDGTADRIMGTYTSSGFIPYRNDTALGDAATKTVGIATGNVPLVDNLGMILLSVQTANDSAAIDFTGLGTTYRELVFVLSNIDPVTDGAGLQLLVQTGGSTWQATNYAFHRHDMPTNASTYSAGNATAGTAFLITAPSAIGLAVTERLSGRVVVSIGAASVKPIQSDVVYANTAGVITGASAKGCWAGGTDAITGIRFQMDNGNISLGTIAMFGVR